MRVKEFRFYIERNAKGRMNEKAIVCIIQNSAEEN